MVKQFGCLIGCLMFACYFQQCWRTTCTVTDVQYEERSGLVGGDEWTVTCVAPNGYQFKSIFYGPFYKAGDHLCVEYLYQGEDYPLAWSPVNCNEN
jgi:hypothetical protein